MPSIDQLESLLAARRETRPEEGYWSDFLCEFHHRQREQAVRKSALGMAWGRLSDWVAEVGPTKWAYGVGLAYAVVTVGAIMLPRTPDFEMLPSAPVRHTVDPVPAKGSVPAVEQLEQLDLGPSTQGSADEQVF